MESNIPSHKYHINNVHYLNFEPNKLSHKVQMNQSNLFGRAPGDCIFRGIVLSTRTSVCWRFTVLCALNRPVQVSLLLLHLLHVFFQHSRAAQCRVLHDALSETDSLDSLATFLNNLCSFHVRVGTEVMDHVGRVICCNKCHFYGHTSYQSI